MWLVISTVPLSPTLLWITYPTLDSSSLRTSDQPGTTLGLRLLHKTPWTYPPPFLTLKTDASNVRRGYQSSHGHQGQGMWPDLMTSLHINTKELTTVLLALRQVQDIRDGTKMVLSDNTTTVQCIIKQESVMSRAVLTTSERLLEEAHERNLTLTAPTSLVSICNYGFGSAN